MSLGILSQTRIRYFVLAFLVYLLSAYLFAAGLAVWLFREKLSSLLKLIALALSFPLSLHLIATVSILYLVLGSLQITPDELGIVEGGLISIFLYFGLPLASASSLVFLERFISFGLNSMIGLFYLFYYGGLRYGKAQSCTDQ